MDWYRTLSLLGARQITNISTNWLMIGINGVAGGVSTIWTDKIPQKNPQSQNKRDTDPKPKAKPSPSPRIQSRVTGWGWWRRSRDGWWRRSSRDWWWRRRSRDWWWRWRGSSAGCWGSRSAENTKVTATKPRSRLAGLKYCNEKSWGIVYVLFFGKYSPRPGVSIWDVSSIV